MGLEDILQELGTTKRVFDDNGKLTIGGEEAYKELLRIVAGLHHIGAISETPDKIEAYCDEIIRLGF